MHEELHDSSSRGPKDSEAERELMLQRVIAAMEEHEALGEVRSTRCHVCQDLLRVTPLGDTAWRLVCPCGRYADNLRGI